MNDSTQAISVKVAAADDLPGIHEVANQTWPATYAGMLPDEDIASFLEANYNLDRLTFIRDSMGDGMLVAVNAGKVIGYVMITKDRDGVAQIWAIYVLPEWQRRGAGRLLWEAAVERGRQLESDELVLWVLDGNEPARRFYERQGAHAAEERDFPVGEGSVREICYRIALN
ncbi:MAG: GNAT family N-acetyltransferase [Chloroflexia bacterium]|nr:GNAT family N-acetyltransferase [Chloroflexia bacterium]